MSRLVACGDCSVTETEESEGRNTLAGETGDPSVVQLRLTQNSGLKSRGQRWPSSALLCLVAQGQSTAVSTPGRAWTTGLGDEDLDKVGIERVADPGPVLGALWSRQWRYIAHAGRP